MNIFNKVFGTNKVNIGRNNIMSIRGMNTCIIGNKNGNSVNINGRQYNLPPGNVSIVGDKVYLNGQPYNLDDPDIKKADSTTVINIVVEGDTENVECNGAVMVTGSAKDISTAGDVTVGKDCGAINTSGDVEVKGNVSGHINTMGDVEIDGNCSGNVSTMGDVVVRSTRR